MIINTAGEYTLQYTATDACGNSTTVERDLVVEGPPRTVLYTDGTFIINERQRDIEANIQAHGQPTNIYIPFDPNGDTAVDKYIFTSTSQRPWNAQASSITSVEIGSDISPTSTLQWFYGFTSCESMNISKLNTSMVTTMLEMFYNCTALTSLDVSHFDTRLVTDMSGMFQLCQSLTSLDVSGFNTSSVTTMHTIFSGCQALTELNVDNFNTGLVTNMYAMFQGCQALTELDLSGFDTKNVTTMGDMFLDCYALTTLDVSGFDTTSVTSMSRMFKNCKVLVVADLATFDTSIVTNMQEMFRTCKELTTIYASASFVVSQVTNSTNMFDSMSTNLRGGAGTTWSSLSSRPKDKTYARIDNPPDAPGYFTAKS